MRNQRNIKIIKVQESVLPHVLSTPNCTEDFDGSIVTYHQAGHQAWLAKNSAYKTMYSFIMSERRRIWKAEANILQNEFLTVAQWDEILIQYDYRCAYCGCKWGYGPGEKHPTKDYVIPLAMGGKHTKENIVLACASCNSSKNGRSPQQWVIDTANKKVRQVLEWQSFTFSSDMVSFRSFLEEMQSYYQDLKSYVSEQPLTSMRLGVVSQQLNVLSQQLDNIKSFVDGSFGYHVQQAQAKSAQLGSDITKLQQNWKVYQSLNISDSQISADAVSSAIGGAQKQQAALSQRIAVAQKKGMLITVKARISIRRRVNTFLA